VEVDDPEALLKYLAARKIIVRNRSGIRHCRRCIRITIGTYQQNDQLLDALASFEKFNK
jgi:histidinol-phosphate aminotransferase